jgi:hypothetical protein
MCNVSFDCLQFLSETFLTLRRINRDANINEGARGGVLIKPLRYKPAGRGLDSRWCHWNFQWHNPSGRTMALGSTQPLT